MIVYIYIVQWCRDRLLHGFENKPVSMVPWTSLKTLRRGVENGYFYPVKIIKSVFACSRLFIGNHGSGVESGYFGVKILLSPVPCLYFVNQGRGA